MPKQSKLLLYALIWAAYYFRLPALFANHFHADEALFSSWARLIAVWRDPLLASQAVDKPPFLFYSQALFYPLLGAVEWTARLPDFIASLLLIPLTALLGWRLYNSQGTSLFAALIIAVSPMAIQYSATAYTDPLLASLLVLSLLLITGSRRPAWSGLIFGLALLTKYQAWLFMPLIFAFAWLKNWKVRDWLGWLLACVTPLFLMAIWEFARTAELEIWSNQINNFGGLRIIYSWELFPRLKLWFEHWHVLLGSHFFLSLFFFAGGVLLIRAMTRRSPDGLPDIVFILYLAAYIIFHWLLAVPAWDRYLLPVLPFAALILSRGVVVSIKWIIGRLEQMGIAAQAGHRTISPILVVAAVWFLLSAPTAQRARSGMWPVGGQPAADQGAWQVAALLDDQPYGTVLYDHWYSWHWRYYFFDKGVYTSWFPNPAALSEDLAAFGESGGSRYIVLPGSAAARPVYRAITDAGFTLEEEFHTSYEPGMILYRLKHE